MTSNPPAVDRHPLLAARAADAPFAWRGGRPVGVRRFLADAAAQAALMPAGGAVVNLCLDRYRFAVGFAAALQRGLTSLFPPNAMPDTLARLGARFPGLAALSDDASLADDLPRVPLAALDDDAPDADDRGMPTLSGTLAAAVLLTSGSTGAPQAHAKDWTTLVRNVDAAARRLADCIGRPTLQGLTLVGTVPAQHSYGFESTVLLAMLGGAAFDASRPFFPADVAAALAAVPRPRALVTTPVHLRALMRSEVALPPVDLVLSATAPLSPQLAQACERRTGGALIEIYGCTEAGQVASRRTALGESWRTFGELEVHAVAPSPELPDGGFAVRGGHVAAETPLADVLELEDARRFRLLGRAGDLIHVAGKRSSLGHLDYHLNSLQGVEDGAFWMPPDRADRVVRTVAFVVAPGVGDAQILDGLRGRVEPQFLPRRIVRLDTLPREATGKLTERALRELAAAHGEATE
jgi:acyl-coenzyme A synthetase/AMP-(fatty) acid ligase